jgi:gamma-glutamylaminecyclotransferase
MYNKSDWHFRDGIWYSKPNVLQDNLVAVYGTLKKGYSNYHRHLSSAKFVGSGVTKNKYPLLIQGLPYMVDQKGEGHNVEVDIFKVSDATLGSLDMLEGHPRWYVRKEIPIFTDGRILTCWLYFNPKEIHSHSQMYKRYVQNVGFQSSKWEDVESLLNEI